MRPNVTDRLRKTTQTDSTFFVSFTAPNSLLLFYWGADKCFIPMTDCFVWQITRRFNIFFIFFLCDRRSNTMSCDGIDRERTRGEGMHYLVVSLCEIVFFLSSFCILIVKRTASSEWCAVARGKLLRKTTAVFSSPFHYLSLSLFLSGIRLNSNLFGLIYYIIQNAHDAVSVGMWVMQEREVLGIRHCRT